MGLLFVLIACSGCPSNAGAWLGLGIYTARWRAPGLSPSDKATGRLAEVYGGHPAVDVLGSLRSATHHTRVVLADVAIFIRALDVPVDLKVVRICNLRQGGTWGRWDGEVSSTSGMTGGAVPF